tara:strand:- start:71403 stop:71999 length:597 start_codon:yes stop_codon:yes gene_type:complete
MIGRLTGTLVAKQPPQLLLDVQGVGYEVDAPMSTFYRLPAVGEQVCLYTHLVVREDAQLLYGFYDEQERRLFRTLIKVNGVGPKLAITILSGIEPNAFARCISDNDTASLVRLPGVGKKTAERLIVEMRDRLADWNETMTAIDVQSLTSHAVSNAINDAVSALVSLGYKPNDANKAIAKIKGDDLSSEDLIKQALKTI